MLDYFWGKDFRTSDYMLLVKNKYRYMDYFICLMKYY